MTSPVIINMDSRLKMKAMKKAKKNGLPFSSVIKFAVKAYVEDRFNVDFVDNEEKFNAKTRKELDEIMRDIKRGKNLSPAFSTIEEVRAYLKK